MRYMAAAEFKAKCLKVMEEVAATGEEVIVTKRGTPVVRVVPTPGAAAEPPAIGWGAGAHFHVPGSPDLLDPVDAEYWPYDFDHLDPPSDGKDGGAS